MTSPQTDPILQIPIYTIAADALPRDRSTLDPAALAELQASIATTGLRQPIEVWRLSTPTPEHQYGLISGLRRLTAHINLNALRPEAFQTIAAFLRTPTDLPAAMAAMIAENEIRSEITPWDKARILTEAVAQDLFPTLDAASAALHPDASRQKRARLRACAAVVEELDGHFTTPDQMTERHLLRLSAALRGGFTDLFHEILREVRGQSFQTQWSALLPTLLEAGKGEEEIAATPTSAARPRRMLHLRQGLTIRREESPTGYLLRFSGPQARLRGLMDDVMDEVERRFQPMN